METRKRKLDPHDKQIARSNRFKRFQKLRQNREETSTTNFNPTREELAREARKKRFQILQAKRQKPITKPVGQKGTKRKPAKRAIKENKLTECAYCHALVWEKESNEKSKDGNHLFSICCSKGRVGLPPIQEPPQQLKEFMKMPHFRENIKVYNSIQAFTSVGAEVDNSLMSSNGPYTYRIQGQVYHRLGSLLPPEGKPPSFGQLYIFDTANEVQNRINTMARNRNSSHLQENIVEGLISMLDESNWLVGEFRKARDKFESEGCEEFTITLIGAKEKGRQHDLPTTDEIAGLIVQKFAERDIIVQYKTLNLQRVSCLHPFYMALQYPLLFPFGEKGFHLEIPYVNRNGKKIKRAFLTIREFYAYEFQTRLTEGKTIIRGGCLLHQYIVDAYTCIEEERLKFHRLNQKKLRADLYNNICDAVGRGDTDPKSIGKRIILPPSFTGGPRYMIENYHDAMAICRSIGNPHLFITITANPGWEEIREHLDAYGNDTANDRPDICSRVFKMKLDELMSDLKEGTFFGPMRAYVYTIEFQKRGLPHAHILLWLEEAIQNPSISDIDEIISAEIPDEKEDPEGYELVKKHMMHGPCGFDRPNNSCMESGVCSKKYPRQFVETSSTDKDGYIIYRRRDDNSKYVMKGQTKLDNRYVVPHNMPLLRKYKAHINVEWCFSSKAVKYIFKYITNGVDKATIIFTNISNGQEGTSKEKVEINEIQNYQECRYLSASETAWRTFAFDIHHQKPAVLKMTVHLEGEQSVIIDEKDDLEEVVTRTTLQDTMFTKWMETNENDLSGRHLTFIQFPKCLSGITRPRIGQNANKEHVLEG